MLTLFSPAKINLFLRVLRRREDGYHDLASLMQAVDLGDTLEFSLSSRDVFLCTDPVLEKDPKNLVLQALKLFRERTGYVAPLTLHLKKHIPLEAGLGGGSSNAATTLWGLNHLFQAGIDDGTLQAWGGELGSDVPFFFSTGTAYCEGRGEQVTSYPRPPLATLYLHKPSFGLSTRAMFQALNLTQQHYAPTQLLDRCYSSEPCFHNDFEEVAFTLYPELAALKERLGASYRFVWMTGSGSSLIGYKPLQPASEGLPLHSLSRISGQWYTHLPA